MVMTKSCKKMNCVVNELEMEVERKKEDMSRNISNISLPSGSNMWSSVPVMPEGNDRGMRTPCRRRFNPRVALFPLTSGYVATWEVQRATARNWGAHSTHGTGQWLSWFPSTV